MNKPCIICHMVTSIDGKMTEDCKPLFDKSKFSAFSLAEIKKLGITVQAKYIK